MTTLECTVTTVGVITLVATGTCTINASQGGNSTFAAASTVSQSFTVTAVGYAIGVTGPGGGIVFYDAGSDQSWGRYLEAAPSGWFGTLGETADPAGLQWKINGVNCKDDVVAITGAVGTAIGTGRANTTAITVACTAEIARAAWAARAYSPVVSGVTINDWFLPSKDELNQLFLERAVVGGFDLTKSYWSSSQSVGTANNAWRHGFSSGITDEREKGFGFLVRPVRAF